MFQDISYCGTRFNLTHLAANTWAVKSYMLVSADADTVAREYLVLYYECIHGEGTFFSSVICFPDMHHIRVCKFLPEKTLCRIESIRLSQGLIIFLLVTSNKTHAVRNDYTSRPLLFCCLVCHCLLFTNFSTDITHISARCRMNSSFALLPKLQN